MDIDVCHLLAHAVPPLYDDLSKGNLTDVGVSLTVTVPITRCSQQNGPIRYVTVCRSSECMA